VSMVLLQHTYPNRPPFRVVELPVARPVDDEDTAIPGVTPLRRVTDRPGA
jgi:hypothetical protein